MMKKVLIFSLVLFMGSSSFSQSLEDINALMEKNSFAPAKTAIDKNLSTGKNAESSEGWYFKGRIYNSLSRDAATSKTDAYNLKLGAFEALKKHQQLDKLGLRMEAEGNKSYLDLYIGLYDLGAQYFNDKNYEAAYNAFAKAQEVEDYILAKKYTYTELKLGSLDTALVLNTASAALNARDTARAVINYKRIADANVTGKDFQQVYEYLVIYYKGKKDDVNLNAMLAKGKAAYPQNDFWNAIEMEKLAESGDKKAMFAKYDEVFQKDPSNFASNYNYAIELYNGSYGKDVQNPDPAYKEKLTAVLKAIIPSEKNMEATTLMANHLFNYAADYSTSAAAIKDKGAKPDDIKKKKELNALALVKMDETIPYAEKVIKYYSEMPSLTNRQKVNYQTAVGYLSDIYLAKGNPKKAAEYDKIRDSIKF